MSFYYGYQYHNRSQSNSLPENNNHISRMTATMDEFSRYINLHKAFNFKGANLPEDVQEKVQLVAERRQPAHRAVEEVKVDAEAEDFIQKRHRAFELNKWQTFKE